MSDSSDAALLAARKLLAAAECEALDEVLAIRAAAAAIYDEVVALRAEAERLAESAREEQARLSAEREELDALREEIEERARSVGDVSASATTPAPDPALAGARAEMAALTQLLDELQGRISELGGQLGGGAEGSM